MGDDSRSEDSNTTTTGTAGAHIEEVTPPQDSTAPSKGSSIGANISEITEPAFCPARSVEELLAAHLVNDAIWRVTNPSDVSIDTANSAELIAGIHITEGSTYAFDQILMGISIQHYTCHTRMICHSIIDQHSLTVLLT